MLKYSSSLFRQSSWDEKTALFAEDGLLFLLVLIYKSILSLKDIKLAGDIVKHDYDYRGDYGSYILV